MAFIDSANEDADLLVDAVGPDLSVHFFAADADDLEQIAAILNGYVELDGYQSLTFEQFEATRQLCRRVAEAVGKKIESDPETVVAE